MKRAYTDHFLNVVCPSFPHKLFPVFEWVCPRENEKQELKKNWKTQS